MIVKFFKKSGGQRGASNSMDYLLGRNRDREDARLLQGDPDLSVAIADGCGFKTRYTVGCLSFEEENIPEDQKREIMASFENTLLAGLDSDQYNITWVEHRDKGRLELNFFIPNVELETGKRLQPYYDKVDRGLVDSWKQVTNYQYGLTDPDEPTKKQLLQSAQNLPKTKKQALEAITGGIEGLVLAGEVKDREDVLKALETAGLEIARVTKTSISIKDPDGGQNLRLKGFYYEQTFGISNELQETIRERSRDHTKGLRTNVQEAQRKLEQFVERRREQFSKKYRRTEQSIDSGLQNENARIDTKPSKSINDDLGSSEHSRGGFISSNRGIDNGMVEDWNSQRDEPSNSEARTEIQATGGVGETGSYQRREILLPSRTEEQKRDLHEQQRLQRTEILRGKHENRVATALRNQFKRLSNGVKRLGDALQRVRKPFKRSVNGEWLAERAERTVTNSQQAITRAERAIAECERAINQKIDRSKQINLTAQEQFRQALDKEKQTIKQSNRESQSRGMSR